MAKGTRKYRTPAVIEWLDDVDVNDFTPPDAEWEIRFPDRVRIEGMRPDEQLTAQQLHDGATAKMYFRWSRRWQTVINQALRIRVRIPHNESVYAVTSVVNVDEGNKEVLAMVSRSNVGAV